MIKINLLPHKKAKPVEKGLLRLRALILGITALLAIGFGVYYYMLSSKVGELTDKGEETAKQLKSLKAKIKEVEGYEKRRLEFEQKLNVIKELQKKKVPITPILEEVNKGMIKEVWLTSFTVSDQAFAFDAVAKEDRKNVDIFVERLKGSPLFKDIAVSDLKEVPSNSPGVRTFSFKVTGKLAGAGGKKA